MAHNIAKHTQANKLHTTFRHIHIYAVCTMIKIVKGNININEDSNNSNNKQIYFKNVWLHNYIIV